jgi:decaprenyl-phosphate phosphoribosyltransferase
VGETGVIASRGIAAPALLAACRPGQWTKNLLVAAAPLADGTLTDPAVLGHTGVAFVSFSAAASAGYLANDVADADADRRHPAKAGRPVASGALPAGRAVAWAVTLAAGSLVAAMASGWQLAATVTVYLTVTVVYSLVLKHERVFDIAAVAAAFLLRAIAGGTASGIELSRWFLIVAAFGALFLVAGKRYSELVTHGADSGTRRALADYSPSYLRFVWSTAAAVTIGAYCLWAFEVGASVWGPLSVAPFVLAILRAALDMDQGTVEDPERALATDPVILSLALTWVVLFAASAYTV